MAAPDQDDVRGTADRGTGTAAHPYKLPAVTVKARLPPTAVPISTTRQSKIPGSGTAADPYRLPAITVEGRLPVAMSVLRPPPQTSHTPELEFYEQAIASQRVIHEIEDAARATGQRGTDAYSLQLLGKRLAEERTSAADRFEKLRNAIESSHGVRTLAEVEKVSKAFVESVPRDDRERLLLMQAVAEIVDRHRDAQDIADGIDISKRTQALHDRPDAHWRLKIQRLAERTGLEPQLVEAILRAEQDASYPGVIDPNEYSLLKELPHLGPMYSVARAMSAVIDVLDPLAKIGIYFVPYVGNSLVAYETVTGKSALDDRQLASWERILGGVLIVIPAIKGAMAIGKGAQRLLSGSSRLSETYRALAPAVAGLSRRMGRSAEPALTLLSRLGRLPAEKVDRLRRSMSAARLAGKALKLDEASAALVRDIEQAFREFNGASAAGERAIQELAPHLQRILASPGQEAVAGMVLGRIFGRVRPAAGATELAAARIRALLEVRWNQAVTELRGSADAAAREAFEAMSSPGTTAESLGQLVRKKLFNPIRTAAVRRIKADAELAQLLESEAGIYVGSAKGDPGLYIRGLSQANQVTKIGLDFDHAETGLAKAVDAARRSGNYRELLSIINAENLQLLTARENRNVIETLRRVSEAWITGHIGTPP